jgi:hypothetical protein
MAGIGSFRRDGSDTMMAGALAVAPSLRTLRGRVLSCLYINEMTDGELLEAYRQRYNGGEYRSISTRRRELVDMGLVVDTSRRKLNPRSGVQNIIWSLTSRAVHLLQDTRVVDVSQQAPVSQIDDEDYPF